jgi:flagellar biosynthesis protein FlhG
LPRWRIEERTPSWPRREDQALVQARRPALRRGRGGTIAVTSGKEAGKTNIVTNLAIALARQGIRVLVLDGDLGLANRPFSRRAAVRPWDVILGGRNLWTWCSKGRTDPRGAGVLRRRRAGEPGRVPTEVLRFLSELDGEVDIILIDSPSGIGHHATSLIQGADQILVVTTPEPTSFSDAYAMIKVLVRRPLKCTPALLVNQADSEESAIAVARRVKNVAKRFLNLDVDYWGYILDDESVPKSVLRQEPFLSTDPYSPASSCIYQLARRVMGQQGRNGGPGVTHTKDRGHEVAETTLSIVDPSEEA